MTVQLPTQKSTSDYDPELWKYLQRTSRRELPRKGSPQLIALWPLAAQYLRTGSHPRSTHTHVPSITSEKPKSGWTFLRGEVCSWCEIKLMLVIFRSNWIFCLNVGIGSFFFLGKKLLKVLFYVGLKGDLISFSWS